jgi:hypothetical protein
LEGKEIVANIDFNKRKKKDISDRDDYFDTELYEQRKYCEHPFAWMDGFKGLLTRYEKLDDTWLSMNIMGMIHIFSRKNFKHIINNNHI